MTSQLQLSYPEAPYNRLPQSINFDLDTYKDKNYLTHNFHPYPAKFVPQIPRIVIEALTQKGEVILDPFCGSGTTLVEGNVIGRPAIGFDLNPLAGLISKVKTTVLTAEQLTEIDAAVRMAEQLYVSVKSGGYDTLENLPIPDFRNRDHWFQSHVQIELAALKKIIWQTQEGPALDFLKVAFSAIIVKVSNQDSDTRWVAVDKQIYPGAAVQAFISKVTDMVVRIKQFQKLEPAQSHVYVQSITEPISLSPASVDLVMTSPPYLNSYDYYLYHKLRFFWLGLDHYPVQDAEIGSRNKHCDRGEGVETYTTGIQTALKEMHRLLKSGKFLCVVIGDSILRGSLINMNQLYRDICIGVGFTFTHSFSYDQRRYTSSFTRNLKTAHKQSHIMFFQKQ